MATDLPLIDVHTHAMPLPLLRRLVAEVGCDRVLVGTDAPFGLADRRPRETVAELELDPAEERAILGGTVAGLLPAGRTDAMAAP